MPSIIHDYTRPWMGMPYTVWMLYGSLLSIHIIGACVTGVIGASAVALMWGSKSERYPSHVVMLGFLAGFEILSGIALAVASVDITAASLCKNVVLYLFAVFVIEALLFMRMRGVAYPTNLALSPVLASLVLMLTAISYGI